MQAPPYTISNESVTVVWKGKTHAVQRGTPNYLKLREAIMAEDWEAIPGFLTIALSIENWAKGRFKTNAQKDTMYYDDVPLPQELNKRILNMVSRGEDPIAFFAFWERLQRNPSWRSVQQLWPFLQHQGIPLTKDGRFLAYKGLKSNYKDVHTGKVDNAPGTINKMPRNMISDDPKEACHYGFHVGAESYARSFAQGQVVICEVDPEHVVCIPYDSSQQKMRVCEYKVIGNYGSTLSSTTHAVDVHDPDEEEDENEDEIDQDEVEFSDVDHSDEDDGDLGEDSEEDERAIELVLEDSIDKLSTSQGSGTKPPKGFAKQHKLDMAGLMKESIDTLRQYAGKGLKILGASKIPGGKTALVARILEVRDRSTADG